MSRKWYGSPEHLAAIQRANSGNLEKPDPEVIKKAKKSKKRHPSRLTRLQQEAKSSGFPGYSDPSFGQKILSYEDYISSDWWKWRRKQKKDKAGYFCNRCKSGRDLQVHHISYKHLWCERDDELEVLCKTCHHDHHFPSPDDFRAGL